MLNKFLFVFLFLILTCVSASVYADEKYYYILETGKLSEDAKLCDKFIRKNSSKFTDQINEINTKYNVRAMQDVATIIESTKFKEYTEHLRVCSLSYKYKDSINHFREAYSNLYYLIHVDFNKERGTHNFELTDGLDKLIINSIQGILRSKRVPNPNLRKRVPVIQDIS